MQRTASKPATDVLRVCHTRFRRVARCRGLGSPSRICLVRFHQAPVRSTGSALIAAKCLLAPCERRDYEANAKLHPKCRFRCRESASDYILLANRLLCCSTVALALRALFPPAVQFVRLLHIDSSPHPSTSISKRDAGRAGAAAGSQREGLECALAAARNQRWKDNTQYRDRECTWHGG
jgi:hypothetical protein